MNLQESIRRILREGGFAPLPIRRRISTDDLEEAFAYSLETNATHMDNPNTVLYKEKKPSLWVFSKFVIDDMVTLIEQEYFTNDNRIYFSDTDEDDETYHEKIRQPLLRHYGKRIKEKYDEVMSSNDEEIIQESIRRTLREVRVPRSERVELYKDDNIIVVVPLTHRALQKYAHQCQWCINDDLTDWEEYHKGKHAVIIQRNPKKSKKGITGMETYGEIFVLSRLDEGMWDWKTATDILGYDFGGSKEKASDYYVNISNDINNFATNIVYYSPENGIYDQEDNFLWNFNIEINDIPNVKPKVIEIMDDYLQENEEMALQENIRRILREEVSLMDKIRNLFTKKQPTPEDRLLDVIVEFIESNFDIIETQARGEFLYRLDGNLVMSYNKKFKRLDYRSDLAKTIHDYIPDDRLLHLDSELMGKVFAKLFNKPVIAALGYSMMG